MLRILLIDKKKVISIGSKIKNSRPKLQFMGLVKLKYKDFIKLYKFFISLKNPKIDMTSFLDIAIKKKNFS